MATFAELSSISGSWISDGDCDALPESDPSIPIIFGRTSETKLLHSTFQRILQSKRAATVVLHGESGVGKTALVDTMRLPIVQHGGFFCAGKFSQNADVQEPYSAIMAAFSDLCDLVLQADDFGEERRQQIHQALGSDAYILNKAVSNLSPFIIKDNNDELMECSVDRWNETSLSKFKVACKTFLHAMATEDHPVAIFIDDIQWMDVGSRHVLELILKDDTLENVLMVLAYRDDEAEKVVSILPTSPDLVDIQLKTLDSSAIYEMVCACMGSGFESLRDLCALIKKRTDGNPFHVREFLSVILSEGFLAYDPEQQIWVFDVEEIQSQIMGLSTSAELLARKIDLVDENVRDILKMASFVGYFFTGQVVLEAVSRLHLRNQGRNEAESEFSVNNSHRYMEDAVQVGFIEKIRDGYQFSHDIIQTAFKELVAGKEEAQTMHRVIGEAILSQGGDDDAFIHQAVVHLNAASEPLFSDEKLRYMLQLNIKGAKYCIRKSGFTAARSLLYYGLDLVGSDQGWTDQFYDLTFEMTELLAKTELVLGNFDACKEATIEALSHAKSDTMKVNSLLIDLEVRIANHELDQFMLRTNRALKTLGVKMPRNVKKHHVIFKLVQIKWMIRRKTDDQIVALSKMDDPLISAALTVLGLLCIETLLLDMENTAVYSALIAMELSLKNGLSPTSPIAFVMYGVVEATIGNQSEAYRFGKLALTLLTKIGAKEIVAPTNALYATLLAYRKERLVDLKHQLHEAGEIGFQVGDITHGLFCLSQSYVMDLMNGRNLKDLEFEMRLCQNRTMELGQKTVLSWLHPVLQYVMNLRSHTCSSSDIFVLTGEAMNETRFMVAHNPALRVAAMILKCVLASTFRYFDKAITFYTTAQRLGNIAQLSHGQISLLLYASFAHFELYRSKRKRRHWHKGRKLKQQLERLVTGGYPDSESWLAFLGVMEVSVRSRVNFDEIRNAYSQGISYLKANGPCQLEALLNEQAGFDLARRGYHSEAQVYFDRALHIYEHKWCSIANYDWLQEEVARLHTTRSEQEQGPNAPQVGNLIICT